MITPFAITIPRFLPSANVIRHRAAETGYRCDGTGYDRFEGIGYCMTHRSVLVARESFFILLETVQQEDRVVHRNTKLKDCYQCLCQIRNLTQENIRSHVIQDRDSDTEQEQDRTTKDVPVISSTMKENSAAIAT